MNSAQRKARAEAIEVLARNYPGVDAQALQDALFRLSVQALENALKMCSDCTWEDRRPLLRERLAVIGLKHGITLDVFFNGDPRGFPIRVRLPDGSSNSFTSDGWGIGPQD